MGRPTPHPRLSDEIRRQAVNHVAAALDVDAGKRRRGELPAIASAVDTAQLAVDALIDFLWKKLRGDMQDRITTLIYAAKGAVEDQRKIGFLKRSLAALDGQEIAATEIKKPKRGGKGGKAKRA